MEKRVFIIHGWDYTPDSNWYSWLKQDLETKGFQVHVPAMPEPAEPKIEAWVSHLAKIVGDIDENTFFVGHSIGCQTILRYLERLPADKKVGGALFVAGWFNLQNMEGEEVEKIAGPWLKTPIDFEKVKNAIGNLRVVLSEDDPYDCVEENTEIFKQKLNADVFIEEHSGHFTGAQYPGILNGLLDVLK